VTLNDHHLLTIAADEAENFILWFESGIIATSTPIVINLLNYDLILQWRGIKTKIERFEAAIRCHCCDSTISLKKTSIIGKANRLPGKQLYELAAEMNDFFNQITKTNGLLSRFLKVSIIGCLGLCAVYTYFLKAKSIDQVPAEVIGMLIFIALALVLGMQSFLEVYYICKSSYPKLCSLMAHDQTEVGDIYGGLIEFYIRNRQCYLIMNGYPFLPITMLALIGWTFSCFCIITEVLRRNDLAGSKLM
jgi:hypothetical protein